MKATGTISADPAEGDFSLSFFASSGCRVEIVSAAALLADERLLTLWDQLATDAAEPNPFAERWYLTAALKALDGRRNVSLATVWHDGLIGILPLQHQPRYAGLPVGYLQNWQNHNAFLGTPLIRRGSENMFWNALLAHLDKASQGALFLHLTGLPTAGLVVAALEQVCRSAARRYALVYREERALLEKGLTPDAYLETNVRGKKRKELRRQQKRLAEEGELTFTRSDGSNGLDDWINDFLTLERRGWKGANGSALDCTDGTRMLFRNALHGAVAAHRLELLDLRLNGRPIAMLVNFLTSPGSFSFKTAFDEGYSRFSPGVLLQIENLALLEREDIDWCDHWALFDRHRWRHQADGICRSAGG
jgi:CelD/BcsL family acetyltransferase involved in cellulose biosynthesis